LQFNGQDFQLRNADQHAVILNALDVAPTQALRQQISVASGVNGPSILMRAPHFDVTRNLGQDFMHDQLEGSLGYEIRLFLHHAIFVAHFFDLDYLNVEMSWSPLS
jgi:hypothetical protein